MHAFEGGLLLAAVNNTRAKSARKMCPEFGFCIASRDPCARLALVHHFTWPLTASAGAQRVPKDGGFDARSV
jgi:hypothetical protein